MKEENESVIKQRKSLCEHLERPLLPFGFEYHTRMRATKYISILLHNSENSYSTDPCYLSWEKYITSSKIKYFLFIEAQTYFRVENLVGR